MKKICAFLAVVLSLAFAGLTFAQDKKAADAKPAVEAKKDEAKSAAAPEAKKEVAKPAPTPNKGDVAWMLTSTALVLMMSVPALALFYGGMVRSKNMLSMLMQVFFTVCIICVIWVIYGYSLAFSEGGTFNAFVGGFSKAFLAGITPDTTAETFTDGAVIPEYVYICFQMTFAAITPAIRCCAN